MLSPTAETDTETSIEIAEENHKIAAYAIMQTFREAQELVASTKEYAYQAVDAVIRCGAMLNAKKEEVGRGHWLKWRDAYLPELKKSHATVERYMTLANSSCCEEFKVAAPKTITSAYRVAGILPDPVLSQRTRVAPQSRPLKPVGGKSSALTLIHEFYAQKPIEALLRVTDFSGWDEVELETWISLLAPLMQIRNQMAYALKVKIVSEPSEHASR